MWGRRVWGFAGGNTYQARTPVATPQAAMQRNNRAPAADNGRITVYNAR